MSDSHLTREILWAFATGEISADELLVLALKHLEQSCLICQDEIQTFQREKNGLAGLFPLAFQIASTSLGERRPGIEKTEKAAARELRELQKLAHEERLRKVERARTRFATPALAEALLDTVRSCLPHAPRDAESWAHLTILVSMRASEREFPVAPQMTLSFAHVANALRCQGKNGEARGTFAHVRHLIIHHGVTDPLTLAEIDRLEASLHIDARQTRRASQLLRRSANLFAASGEYLAAARSLIKLGMTYRVNGYPREGMEAIRKALPLIPSSERHLKLCAVHNAANCLCDAGEIHEAAEILSLHAPLYESFSDGWPQQSRRWVSAKITAGLGKDEEAERLFLDLRDEFDAEGKAYDAALVSLDLMLFYLERDRPEKLPELAETMLQTFGRERVNQEALISVALFSRAAEREEVTPRVVVGLRGVILKHQRQAGCVGDSSPSAM